MAGRSHAVLHLNYPEGLRGTSLEAKVLYTRLLSDDALNQAGVLPLRVALWADDCEMSEGVVDKVLRELEDKRYAYTDYKTHQVLIRTFIRNDGVADIPNVLWAGCRSALNLRSRKLRRVLAGELRKLAPQPPDKVNEKTGKRYVYPDPHGTADKIDPGPPDDTERDASSHVASHRIPSDPIASDGTSHAGSPGGGGGGGGGGEVPVGENSSLKKKTLSRASRSKTHTAEPDGFDDFWTAYPAKVGKIKAKAAYAKALDGGAEPAHLLSAARAYARWITATGKQGYVAHPTTWLNQGRWDDELPEPTELRLVTGHATHRPSTTDARVNAALALAARYEQEENE